jgi:hypothetical protein
MQFFYNQIEPSLQKLRDENLDNGVKAALRNYLIVSLVSTLEYFFKKLENTYAVYHIAFCYPYYSLPHGEKHDRRKLCL